MQHRVCFVYVKNLHDKSSQDMLKKGKDPDLEGPDVNLKDKDSFVYTRTKSLPLKDKSYWNCVYSQKERHVFSQ